MGLPAQPQRYSVADYLRRERDSLDKHEYHDGQILLMAGGTADHSLIVANVIATLHSRLKGKPCRVYDSNLRIRIPRTVLYTYPDASVICGRLEFDPNDPSGETVVNAGLIVEVLSPSTEAYDRGEKFGYYRQLDSLREYIMVTQAAPRVESFLRQNDGSWLFTAFSGPTASASLRSLEIELPLAEVYAGVELPAS